MAIAAILSVVAYLGAVAADHPDIDTPENLNKFSGFLRIGAVILLVVGLIMALMSLDAGDIGMAGLSFFVVLLLGVYDYTIMAKKKSQAAKEGMKKAGKEYLETKKEIEKGPDQVTNVQGDMVDQKTDQTHVDQSTTNVDTIDQSTTNVDQSRTVKDQRTQVEDSVVNRSDITASAEGQQADQPATEAAGNQAGGQPPAGQAQPQGGQPQGGQPQGGQPNAVQYCPSCGEEVQPDWNTCINCGYDL